MKSKLNIYTSFVSPKTLDLFIGSNILPIFIIRSIHTSKLIGMYSDTSIHFKELSPSNSLYQAKRDGLIGMTDFEKRYTIEMSEINFQDVIKRLDYLASLCNASGVVLMGYGEDPNQCHRKTLMDLLNYSDLLENKIREAEL